MSSVTFWMRLEPYTRLEDMDTGLQARVSDPLWLLARQWQTGEFGAEDAGTPVQARVRLERSPLSRFAAAGAAPVPYRGEVPLEALAEREPLQVAADPRRDRRLAAEAGQMFLRMLERAGVSAATRTAFAREGAFSLAADAGDDDAGAAYLALMAGRVPDGFKLYAALASGLPPSPAIPAADAPKLTAVRPAYRAWYEARYGAVADSAWVPERLEYSFAVAAPAGEDGELVLEAAEYPGGELDWHAFDVAADRTLGAGPGDEPAADVVRTVMPAPVRYPGIAADRWWQFEDARVNLSRVEGDPDELLRLLLVDFSLLYSNDWFVVPVDATFGAAYRFKTLIVTDAFGERTLVPHYAQREGADWRMFSVSPTDDVLFLPPVLSGSLHGEPVEDVGFVRDELANLVWAVERLAPSLNGGAFDREAARRRSPDETPPQAEPGELRYRLATTVPENWIPFQPVRFGDGAQIRLRRAAALLDSADGGLAFSRPLGRLLEPENEAFSLHEEEIPRTGARVTRRYQYARWTDGSTALWLTRRKSAGRGETSSELRFDVTAESG